MKNRKAGVSFCRWSTLFRHEPLLHWYAHDEGEAVRALTRLEVDGGDRVAHLVNYFYSPELIAEVCGELGVASRTNGYRWWSAAQ